MGTRTSEDRYIYNSKPGDQLDMLHRANCSHVTYFGSRHEAPSGEWEYTSNRTRKLCFTDLEEFRSWMDAETEFETCGCTRWGRHTSATVNALT